VHPADVVLIGARNLDPPEVEFIAASGLRTGEGELAAALEGVDAAYVAFDADVLDPDDEISCFMPEPSGFTVVEAAAMLRRIPAERPVAGAGFTGLGPSPENVAPLARLAGALAL
jgi:arginase